MVDKIDKIRNIGVIAHIDAGKTTTTEGLLYHTGIEHRMGRVDEGTAHMDWMPEEQRRGITITSAVTTVPWKGMAINIIDTPGHVDFTAEVERSLRVLDGVVMVFCGVGGVEAQSETVWHQAERYGVPRLCLVNKLDRRVADYPAVLEQVGQRLGAVAAPLQWPLGAGEDFTGFIDLVSMERVDFLDDGRESEPRPLPEEWRERAEAARRRLVEAVAETDDEIMERYLNGEAIEPARLKAGIRAGTLACRFFPVLCASALKDRGLLRVLDAVIDYLPAPSDRPPLQVKRLKGDGTDERPSRIDAPLTALAFKVFGENYGDLVFTRLYAGRLRRGQKVLNSRTGRREQVGQIWRMHANSRESLETVNAGDIVSLSGLKDAVTGDTLCDPGRPAVIESNRFPQPVLSIAVEPRSQAESERLLEALKAIGREDPTFDWKVHPETGQTVVAGMGELHLEVLLNRIRDFFRVGVHAGRPRVAYRETIARAVKAAGDWHRKIGDKEQRARVVLSLKPESGTGEVSFKPGGAGRAAPPRLLEAVREGVEEAARAGTLAGYPVIRLAVELVEASFADDQGTEVAFVAAAAQAFRQGLERAGAVLLEPVMRFEVVTPNEHLGDVLNDLNRRRAQIDEMDNRGDVLRVIRGRVPLSEMFGYATGLRSLSQGRASFVMEPHDFAPVPEEKAAGVA